MVRKLRHRAAWLIAALVAVMLVGPAVATTITLDTGKSATINQGATGTFSLSATNDAGAITDNFLGWTLGIQVLPASGTNVGTMTPVSLTQPLSNPMPVGTLDVINPLLSTLALSATINGSTQYFLTAAATTDTLGTLAGSTTYNLGNLGITASANAAGTWNVYAVQQSGANYRSYWTDGSANDVQFGNLPNTGNSSILIGTVTAVPEPSTVVLLGMSLASAGWYAWRTRRSPAIEVGRET